MNAATRNHEVFLFSPRPSLLAMAYSTNVLPVLVALTSGVAAKLPTRVILAISRRAETLNARLATPAAALVLVAARRQARKEDIVS